MKRAFALLPLTLLAACGGIEHAGGPVTVTGSQDYGRTQLAPPTMATAKSNDTVMKLTQRSFDTVATPQAINEIDGVAAGSEDGKPVGWFYYVNGIEAS